MKEFNPERLKLAMLARGMTKRALAARLDCSERLVGYHLNGQKNPEAYAAAYSSILSYPESFFYGDVVDLVDERSVNFRALSRMTDREKNRRIVSGSLLINTFDTWLHENYNLPEPSLPAIDEIISDPVINCSGDSDPEKLKRRRKDAQTVADAVRGAWRLADKPISNLLHLMEFHGIRIYSLPQEMECSEAFSFWHNGKPYVFVDSNKTSERLRFDLAHELAHLLMHQGLDATDRTNRNQIEDQADAFAACLLMPTMAFIYFFNGKTAYGDIMASKKHWNVSFLACVHRMHELHLISDWMYSKYNIMASESGRKNEPDSSQKERSQIFPKVMDLLNDDGKTLLDVAVANDMEVGELREYLFGFDTVKRYPHLQFV